MTREEKVKKLITEFRYIADLLEELVSDGEEMPKKEEQEEQNFVVDTIKEPVEEQKKIPKSMIKQDFVVIVSDLFHEIGIPSHFKGYRYLMEIVLKTIEDETYLDGITRKIYPEMAKKNKTTPRSVEQAIRHAIEVAWEKGNLKKVKAIFGYTIVSTKGSPTIKEFIALVSDYIRLDMR